MNRGTQILKAFYEHAKSLGFDYQKHKVYGDYAFQKPKDFVKFIGCRDGKITVFRQGVGRYQIPAPR